MRFVSQTFLIAPWIEELSIRSWFDDPAMAELLVRNGLTPALMLENYLNALAGPCTRRGVELGYTLSINIYDLFARSSAGEWEFAPAKIGFFLDFIRDAARPVVINLRANHFIGESELARELSADETSLARTNTGSVIREMYFNNSIFAPVFSQDETIRLNRFRFGGFQQAAKLLAEFDRAYPGILRAVTVAGELHHYMRNLADASSAGQFLNVEMTDYSDPSIRDFRDWLRRTCADIQALNEKYGTSFAEWKDVVPPGVDLRKHPDAPRWMHMDSYSGGGLPIFGWTANHDDEIDIFVNGRCTGQARRGLARIDVYDQMKDLLRGDSGFRYELDYTLLPPGVHVLHVIVKRGNQERALLARRVFSVFAESFSGLGGVDGMAHPGLDSLPSAAEYGIAGYLDHPPASLGLLFNPYAQEWQRFREWQINSLLDTFARIAEESGLPRSRLFSHQISPQLEGSWNYVAFAVEPRLGKDSLLNTGMNLYGGAVMCPIITEIAGGRPYAVPEFHPRMGKLQSRSVFRDALDFHWKNGAAFVSPYFMNMRHPRHQGVQNTVRDMMIHPLNPALGSNFFYTALVSFLQQPEHS
jgi:hypothetical protein